MYSFGYIAKSEAGGVGMRSFYVLLGDAGGVGRLCVAVDQPVCGH
jgi:hypothetical protein